MKNLNSQTHIFLVDDDQDDREIFVDALTEVNNSVVLTQAENGLQLIEILNLPPEQLPEVIFLDMNMPIMNGFECLKEIRSFKNKMQSLNIVMLTTCGLPNSIETAKNLGASHYAVKPNSYNALKVLIDKVLHIDWSLNNRQFLIS